MIPGMAARSFFGRWRIFHTGGMVDPLNWITAEWDGVRSWESRAALNRALASDGLHVSRDGFIVPIPARQSGAR